MIVHNFLKTIPVLLFAFWLPWCDARGALLNPPPAGISGTAYGWGPSQVKIVDGPITDARAIDTGGDGNHTLVLRSNGRIASWGDNSEGQCDVPPDLLDAAAVVAGANHSLALRSNGLVVAWGSNGAGQTNVPSLLSGVAQIDAGLSFSVALRSNGTVVAWGWNVFGQTNVPAGLNSVKSISVGGSHTVAVRSNGTVVAWGYNSAGQTNIPSGLNGVTQAAAGSSHNLALRTNGVVVAWGNNGSAQTNVPAGLSGVISVAAGSHSLALRNDGVVFGWGVNNYGQSVGEPSITSTSGIVRLGGVILSNVVAIGARLDRSVALKSDGTIVAWGARRVLPLVPEPMNDLLSISAGGSHSLAVTREGRVVGWGYNYDGRCDPPPISEPVVAVSAGGDHSLALTREGKVHAWGANGYGQTNVPQTATGIVAIAAGEVHSLALKSNGTVLHWGGVNYWTNTPPGGLSNVLAVSGGLFHDMALKKDGTVFVWGANGDGQTNVPAGLNDAMAISSGRFHCLALRSNGTVVAWGWNSAGETNVPPALTNYDSLNNRPGIIGISAGQYYNLVLDRVNRIHKWGDSEDPAIIYPGNFPLQTILGISASAFTEDASNLGLFATHLRNGWRHVGRGGFSRDYVLRGLEDQRSHAVFVRNFGNLADVGVPGDSFIPRPLISVRVGEPQFNSHLRSCIYALDDRIVSPQYPPIHATNGSQLSVGFGGGSVDDFEIALYPLLRLGTLMPGQLTISSPWVTNHTVMPPKVAGPGVVHYKDDYLICANDEFRPGDIVDVSLESTEFDSYLELRDVDTESLISSGFPSYRSYPTPAFESRLRLRLDPDATQTAEWGPGTNLLVRASAYSWEATGKYTLRVREILRIGFRNLAALTTNDISDGLRYRDEHTLTLRGASPGTETAIYARNDGDGGSFTPALSVYNATNDVQLLNGSTTIGADGGVLLPLTTSSQHAYRVHLTSVEADRTNKYLIALYPVVRPGQVVTNALSGSDPVKTNLPSLGVGSWFVDDYLLQGVSVGEQIRLSVDNPGFAPFLQVLYLEDGSETQDPKYTAAANYSWTVGGVAQGAPRNYLIRVTSSTSGGLGSYTLRVERGAGPEVWGFSPGSGIPGMLVRVWGTNFMEGQNPVVTGVKFGGVPGNIITDPYVIGSAQELAAEVPPGGVSGPIAVEINYNTNSPGVSTNSFVVLGALGLVRREGVGGFSFGVTNGVGGLANVVEATTNLSPPVVWQAVMTNSTISPGLWRYTNSDSGSFPARFFRVRVGD